MSVASDKPTAEPTSPLKPVIASRYALAPRHVAAFVLFGLLFLLFNHLPLWHTDLWSHVSYGEWIWQRRALPVEDPFLPLAEGMLVIDSAWLAQVILARVEAWGGAIGLANLFSLIVLATYLVFARVFYLQSGRLSLALVGTAIALAVGFSRLFTVRPEIFGTLCFALLCWLLVRSRAIDDAERPSSAADRAALWLGVPLLFVLWANLHGSFACGIVLLAALTVGRGCEVAWHERCPLAAVRDRPWRRLLLLTELGLLATLVNPYGLDLLIYTGSFAGSANLRDVLEWSPLVILGVGGREFAFSLVLLLVVWRHSRRPVRAYEVICLAVFALAAVVQIRMMTWYAPVFALVVLPHLAEIAGRLWPLRACQPAAVDSEAPLPGKAWRSTLCCALIVWICFALSGLSQPLLGDAPRPAERLYSRYTPREASAYLRENPPAGQIYNPQWWGDWLVWDGPEGLRPFATTMLHLLPASVWQHYLQIERVQPGWGDLLNRYAVTTVVVDRQRQPLLATAMRGADGWRLAYEDDLALVFERHRNDLPVERANP